MSITENRQKREYDGYIAPNRAMSLGAILCEVEDGCFRAKIAAKAYFQIEINGRIYTTLADDEPVEVDFEIPNYFFTIIGDITKLTVLSTGLSSIYFSGIYNLRELNLAGNPNLNIAALPPGIRELSKASASK
jgi:hypothetical protein